MRPSGGLNWRGYCQLGPGSMYGVVGLWSERVELIVMFLVRTIGVVNVDELEARMDLSIKGCST
jgi:hypothetical protein